MNALTKAGAIAAGVAGTISIIGAVVAGIIIILYTKDMRHKESDGDFI